MAGRLVATTGVLPSGQEKIDLFFRDSEGVLRPGRPARHAAEAKRAMSIGSYL